MNEKEFMDFTRALGNYLKIPKTFIANDERMHDVENAVTIAKQLFKDMDISIREDPLQLGALFVCIQGFDIVISNKNEIALFIDLISKADNFEIYAKEDDVSFSIMFGNAFIKQ